MCPQPLPQIQPSQDTQDTRNKGLEIQGLTTHHEQHHEGAPFLCGPQLPQLPQQCVPAPLACCKACGGAKQGRAGSMGAIDHASVLPEGAGGRTHEKMWPPKSKFSSSHIHMTHAEKYEKRGTDNAAHGAQKCREIPQTETVERLPMTPAEEKL